MGEKWDRIWETRAVYDYYEDRQGQVQNVAFPLLIFNRVNFRKKNSYEPLDLISKKFPLSPEGLQHHLCP